MLADKLSSYFDSGVRQRGRAYFDAGRVKLTSLRPSGDIDARVTGAQPYDVRIELDRASRTWTVGATCSCPYMDGGNGFCKHVWATLLAIETRWNYGQLPREVRMEWLEDPDDPLFPDPNEFDALASSLEQLLNGGVRPPFRGTGARKSQKQEPTPAWATLLSSLAAQPHLSMNTARAEGAELVPLYVLEPEEPHSPGHLVLSLAHQTPTPAGRPGKPKRLGLRPADIPRLASQLDRHVCLMLVGAGHSEYTYYSGYTDNHPQSKWTIPARAQPALLPMLFETGRFYQRSAEGELVSLSWDDGEPWRFELSVAAQSKGRRYELVSQLRRGPETIGLSAAERFLQGDPDLMIRGAVIARVQSHGCFNWLAALRRQGPLGIESSHRQRLLDQVARMPACPPVQWPAEWGITEVTDLPPRPEVELTFPGASSRGRQSEAQAQVTFHYAETQIEPFRPGQILMDVKGRRQIRRHLDAERAYWNRLLQLGFQLDSYSGGLCLPDRRTLPAVAALLQEGWTVLGDRKLFRRPGSFAIDVTTGIDWFELHGQMDFEGQTARLPELLAAARKGERFVRLGDGTMGMLPEQWLAQHGALLELGRVEDGEVRFARTQVGLIDALLAQMPEATFDENLAAARDRLRHFAGIQARPAPDGFVGALRPYQEQGLAWLSFLNGFGWGGCLADDMGLGKTIQVLALLLDRRRQGETGPSLIVMPKSIVFNWQREAATFAPELRVLDYTGSGRQGLREDIGNHDLVLTTYGTFKRDIDFLRAHEFNYAILDEAQAIKNPGSLNAKAARLLRARHRLVMTGTPVENRLGDLWSLFEFLNPGMLGSVQAFKAAFENHRDAGAAPANLELLQRMLRPFILRRTKDQVAPELPARSEQTLECVMPTTQAAYYAELRDYYRRSLLKRVEKEGLARNKVHVLEALLRLRQAACHPGLIDKSRHAAESAKMETLLPMLEELRAEGHKALVFSQFTTLLGLLRQQLDQHGAVYEYLDGRTRDRQQRVDRFQTDPQCPLFLISLKAGGTGLNLTAADYVFILDPWWNPAVEAQAIDRTHRIGQHKKVIAYRLITRATVEARIIELQQRKRGLAEAIITEANSLIQDLTREDLEILLS